MRRRCAPRPWPASSASASPSTPRGNASDAGGARRISPDGGDVAVLVVPADEELEIARQSAALLDAAGGERAGHG